MDKLYDILNNISNDMNISSDTLIKLVKEALGTKTPEDSLIDLLGYDKIEEIFYILENKNIIYNNTNNTLYNTTYNTNNNTTYNTNNILNSDTNDTTYNDNNILNSDTYWEYKINKINNTNYTNKNIKLINTSEVEIYYKGINININTHNCSNIFNYEYFNPIQSKSYHIAYNTNDNYVLSAPTGSGKTDVALLSIIRVLFSNGYNSSIEYNTYNSNTLYSNNTNNTLYSNNTYNTNKVIYIVPMRALATEVVNKYNKIYNKIYNNYNNINSNTDNKIYNTDNKIYNTDNKIYNTDNKIYNTDNNTDNKLYNTNSNIYNNGKVVEFTGDTDISTYDANNADIIICTPEKFDFATRKLTNSITGISLLVIDEIHMLDSSRGPVVESIVARIRSMEKQQQQPIRIVAMSATVPNHQDIASFIHGKALHYDISYRPVELESYIVGFKRRVKNNDNIINSKLNNTNINNNTNIINSKINNTNIINNNSKINNINIDDINNINDNNILDEILEEDISDNSILYNNNINDNSILYNNNNNISDNSILYNNINNNISDNICNKYKYLNVDNNKLDYLLNKLYEYTDKQILIFTTTRQSTYKIMNNIIKNNSNIIKYNILNNNNINNNNTNNISNNNNNTNNISNNNNISNTKYIYTHNAGMSRNDRLSTEYAYKHKHINILVCTTTLAWGVNLPADVVFIYNTEYYDRAIGAYKHMDILDIYQIQGRAGRITTNSLYNNSLYDNSLYNTNICNNTNNICNIAYTYILTDSINANNYISKLSSTYKIKSRLHTNIHECILSEVYLHNIQNISDAYEWYRNTYAYCTNTVYGGVSYTDYIDNIIYDMINDDILLLTNNSILYTDNYNNTLYTNKYNINSIMSYSILYYVNIYTYKIYNDNTNILYNNTNSNINNTNILYNDNTNILYNIFILLVSSNIFDNIIIRHNEDIELLNIINIILNNSNIRNNTNTNVLYIVYNDIYNYIKSLHTNILDDSNILINSDKCIILLIYYKYITVTINVTVINILLINIIYLIHYIWI
ncbi:putative DEAD/DEAH helicase family protein [Ecytonucleospora hepatopenaei]|uniref:Putative DEAD/DEAH helicase family protein n=1 Tax=Ecytonucleospora hepatopenaei TaxID=646526 RepID=A0A1W0E7T6_9MICR|nr:putative DEAD/DEAH helicase family protein [Ecytonucleospora hepatopenaei]